MLDARREIIRVCDTWQHNVKVFRSATLPLNTESFCLWHYKLFVGRTLPVTFTFCSPKPRYISSSLFWQKTVRGDNIWTLIRRHYVRVKGNLLAPLGNTSQKAELADVCVCVWWCVPECLHCACLMRIFNELADSWWILLCQGIVCLLRASE